jgi:short-subunit dehydrogenase
MLNWFRKFKRTSTKGFKPVILVTGCSSGIGLALAQLLYNQPRYRVVITARAHSMESLKSTFKEDERFWIRCLDVGVPTEREILIAEIEKSWGGVSVLVNNAGISYRAVVEHMSDADELKQMTTNYFGPVALIRLVLPHMRERGRGKIINISSVSGMLAMPTMASYSASKYALEGMSEALWYEAKPLGVSVSLIQPGFVHSKSFQNVLYTEKSKLAATSDGVYADYYKNMTPFIERLMRLSLTSAPAVAALILKVIRTENPPLWIPATFDASVFYYMRRLIPRRVLLPLLFLSLPRARRWGRKYSNKRGGWGGPNL